MRGLPRPTRKQNGGGSHLYYGRSRAIPHVFADYPLLRGADYPFPLNDKCDVINYLESFSRIESRQRLSQEPQVSWRLHLTRRCCGRMKGKGTRMHPTRRGWLATPLVLILLALGMILPMSAQENTGRVDGTVMDSTGSVI